MHTKMQTKMQAKEFRSRDAERLPPDPAADRRRRDLRRVLVRGVQPAGSPAPDPGQALPLRVGHRAGRHDRQRALPHQVLRHRHALHRLRRGVGLPVPVGRGLPVARPGRGLGAGGLRCLPPGGLRLRPQAGRTRMGIDQPPPPGLAGPPTEDPAHLLVRANEPRVGTGIVTGVLDRVVDWARRSSLWPATFGLACCAIEMMAAGAPRFDLARFGMEVFRASPRQSDLMIVAGRVSQKMAPVLRQIYDQMPDPKWVISMGVCASTGGMFNNYAVVQGVDQVVPVDIYAPGCPPTPETLIHAIMTLHRS